MIKKIGVLLLFNLIYCVATTQTDTLKLIMKIWMVKGMSVNGNAYPEDKMFEDAQYVFNEDHTGIISWEVAREGFYEEIYN